MGIIDDIGKVPLKFAEEFFKKGYFTYIILGAIGFIIYVVFFR